jgi:quercetin dioxygenase-like cupin family protein
MSVTGWKPVWTRRVKRASSAPSTSRDGLEAAIHPRDRRERLSRDADPNEEDTMAHAEHKTFERPDEVRDFERGALQLVEVGGAQIGRLVLQPGWRWSDHVKPLAGTELCEAPHFQYHVAGTLRVRMEDGSELDAVPGDVTALPPGHDAWVVGEEPVVVVDWWGASNYAKG